MAKMDIDAEFWDFHAHNPQVYARLVTLARQAKASGRRKVGIGLLCEVLRWDHFLHTTGTDFKINNDYRSRYARLIMHQERDLVGFFETRALHR